MSVRSRWNWNLKVLVFKERGKPEYPEKNLSEQGREPTTNSTHIWRQRHDSNPGHIGGRRVLPTAPLLLPKRGNGSCFKTVFLKANKRLRMVRWQNGPLTWIWVSNFNLNFEAFLVFIWFFWMQHKHYNNPHLVTKFYMPERFPRVGEALSE